jgi:hypothetical protein
MASNRPSERMTDALTGAHAEAMASVAASPVKHLDGTTWRESRDLGLDWTVVGEEPNALLIWDTRGSTVAKALIGAEPSGVVISERFSGDSSVGIEQRQVCLAHLISDLPRMTGGDKELC